MIKKTVIAQMVVGIGYEDVKNDAPPECLDVGLWGSAMLSQRVYNFEIAVRLVIPRAQHAHGGEERDTALAVAVKAPEQKHGLFGNGFDARVGHRHSRLARKCERHGLPDDRLSP